MLLVTFMCQSVTVLKVMGWLEVWDSLASYQVRAHEALVSTYVARGLESVRPILAQSAVPMMQLQIAYSVRHWQLHHYQLHDGEWLPLNLGACYTGWSFSSC